MTVRHTRESVDPFVPWTVFLASVGAFLAALGAFGEASHWKPEWSNWVDFIIGCAFLGQAVKSAIRWRFGKHRDLRQMLVTLAASRRGGTWINRDEHLAFQASREGLFPARALAVIRIDEDSVHEIDADSPVRAAIIYEQFICFPFTHGVVRSDEAALVTVDEQGNIGGGKLPGTPGTIRSMWRTLRMPTGMGTTRARPDEVQELIAQFVAADRIGDA
jgi:hypothetical protein